MLNLRFALLAALLLSGHYLVLARPQDASTNPDDTSTTESTTSTEATTILSSQEESTTTTEAATAATDAPTADISSSSAAPSNSAGVNDVTNGGGGYLPPSNGGGDAASPPIGGGYVAPPPPALPTSGYQPGRGAVSSAAAAAGGGRNAFASPGGYYPGLGAGGGGASSAASSFGGGFNPYGGGGGGGGGYGAFNPFAFLFNFYRPPHIHQGGGIYINQCTGCQNYADAARDGAEELNDQSACTGYIEKLQENDTEFESFLTPNKLKTKLDAMIAKKPGDITPAVVQCCYKVFPEQIAKATRGAKGINVKELKYTEPEGLEKGKTCKDMVHSFLKLLKGDYPQPKPGQAASDKNRTASKTV